VVLEVLTLLNLQLGMKLWVLGLLHDELGNVGIWRWCE